jgi:sodium-dependent phosphate transporter
MSLSIFRGNPGMQMLSFTCALVASASWLMLCTIKSWPVSTTYSIVSALAGAAVALGGGSGVQWGWNNAKGVSAIYAGMVIAPALSAGFGAIVYLISKYAVLDRQNSVKKGLIVAPFYFFTVTAILTMSIGE